MFPVIDIPCPIDQIVVGATGTHVAGMNITAELGCLREKLTKLEAGPAVIGDWHRLDARIARALLLGQQELAALQREMTDYVRAEPPDPRWYALHSRAHAIIEVMDELRVIGICAQSRLFELQAEANQGSFDDFAYERSR